MTNNKQVISTFKFGYPHLTLKEPKVKFDHINRFAAHDFLKVGFTFQTSRTTKGDIIISTFHERKETPVAAILFSKMRQKKF